LEESLVLAREQDDQNCIAITLDRLGTIAHALGDYTLARTRYEESLALARRVDNRIEVAWSLHNVGCLALDQGDYAAARARLAQSLNLRADYDNDGFVNVLAAFASLAAAEGLPARALRLAGATAALSQRSGLLVQHIQRETYARWLATARRALSEEDAVAAWAEGEEMPPGQAIGYALASREPVAVTASARAEPAPAHGSDQLTVRQREVAALIAQGLSNRQIGESLVITERTVAAHIEHVLNKLDFVSRTQIGVWAAEHGLVVSSIA